jgi:hypothetical protein
MRPRLGPIERLSDACVDRQMLWVLCVACGHAVRFDPRKLIAYKGDVTLRELRDKLHCDRCKTSTPPTIVPTEHGWPSR